MARGVAHRAASWNALNRCARSCYPVVRTVDSLWPAPLARVARVNVFKTKAHEFVFAVDADFGDTCVVMDRSYAFPVATTVVGAREILVADGFDIPGCPLALPSVGPGAVAVFAGPGNGSNILLAFSRYLAPARNHL